MQDIVEGHLGKNRLSALADYQDHWLRFVEDGDRRLEIELMTLRQGGVEANLRTFLDEWSDAKNAIYY